MPRVHDEAQLERQVEDSFQLYSRDRLLHCQYWQQIQPEAVHKEYNKEHESQHHKGKDQQHQNTYHPG